MAKQSQSFYELLGVTREASAQAIREAFLELAKIYHPDSNFYAEITSGPLTAQNIDAFKRITEAYNTLRSPVQRAKYDASLPPPLPTWEGERAEREGGPAATNSGVHRRTWDSFGHSQPVRGTTVEQSEDDLGISISEMMRRRSFWGRASGGLTSLVMAVRAAAKS